MYDTKDARSSLRASEGPSRPVVDPDQGVAAPAYFEFDHLDPSERTPAGSATWLVRTQNMTVAFTQAVGGDRFERRHQAHEYMVVLPHEGATLHVESEDGDGSMAGPAVAIVPPGDSAVWVDGATEVVRLFDVRSADLADAAVNAADYVEPHPHVAPLEPWPAPVGGDRLRLYPCGDIPKVDGRFGRLFRSRAFMVNVFYPSEGPRATDRLSPHHHDDFEQVGIVVEGECTHHIRTPWGRDLAHWRPDEHRPVGSPSMVIIPPPTVHTTQSTGAGRYVHLDLFSPPRVDFSSREGWVLNADEYPAPDGVESWT